MIARFLDAGQHAAWVAGMRSTAATRSCEPPSRNTASGMCRRRWPAPTRSLLELRSSARTPWPRSSPSGPGKPHRRSRRQGATLLRLGHIDLPGTAPGHRHLLIRRNRTTGELAYYRCYSPEPLPLATLVQVAGTRWRVEETFQSGKGLAGLDEHQVRRYASWSCWVTLAMLAHALLAVVRVEERARCPALGQMIPLTCNEIARLFITLISQHVHDTAHRLRWSHWRRRRRARSQASY